jgi:hypothetical protein
VVDHRENSTVGLDDALGGGAQGVPKVVVHQRLGALLPLGDDVEGERR